MYIEYINTGFIVLSAILLMGLSLLFILVKGKSLSENTQARGLPWIFAGIVIAIIIPIYDGYSTKETIDANIKLFKSHNELQCSIGFSSYLVSQKRGWRERNETFTKNDLLVDARYCDKSKEY